VAGPEAGQRLHEDLARAAGDAYVLAGRIGVRRDDDAVPVIGGLGSLRATVVRERIDLVVLGGAVARLPPFDELTATCLDLPLRITEVSEFCEDVFGHVPAGEINAAWFVHLADAPARHPSPVAKRALDVALALALGLAALPVVGLLALLLRRDGGPALFVQTRIGEGARAFVSRRCVPCARATRPRGHKATTRVRRLSVGSCVARTATSCPSSGTSCAAR
jgi:hypothetical protein